MDLWACFLNLIMFRYIYNITLMLTYTEDAPKTKNNIALFHKNIETVFIATARFKACTPIPTIRRAAPPSVALLHQPPCCSIILSILAQSKTHITSHLMEVDTLEIIPHDTNNGSGGGITPKKSTRLGKRKEYMHDDTSQLSACKKKEMRIRLSLTKPSYVLRLCPEPFRSEHRRRLQYLLRRLVNQQDWVGASGVISVYMKGTLKDTSILTNRFKFSALLELLKHVGNHSINLRRVRNLYDIWSKKIGSLKIISMKTWAVQSRHAVLLENILFYLMQGNAEKAYQLAVCIDQEKVDIDPVSKIILGLAFYERWYSSIPEEFQWRDLDQIDGKENSHTEGTSFSNEVRQSKWHNTVESHMADSQYQCYSDSSVMNNKQMSKDVGLNNDMIVSVDVKANHKREQLHQIFQPQDFYLASDENQVTGDPFSNSGGLTQYILSALGRLDLWLLPLRFENVNGLLEFMINHKKSKKAWIAVGLIASKTSLWVQTPPWFAYFYFLF